MSAAATFAPKASTTARRQIVGEPCPAAALADEAADLITAWNGLNAAIGRLDPREWVAFGPTIGEPPASDDEEELDARNVRREISDRIKAVVQLTAHRRATSAKGAAFQALTINTQLIIMLDGGFDAVATADQCEDRENANNHAERALRSVVGFLDMAASGLPPLLVEYFLMSPRMQKGVAADRAVQHFGDT